MQLPREIFETVPGAEQVMNEGSVFYIIEKVDFKDGIRCFIRGAEYHQKGMAAPEVLFALNMVKKIVMEALRIAVRPEFLIGVAVTALKPRKWRIKALESFINCYNDIGYKVISPYLLKKEFMIPCSRELRNITENFLRKLGITEINSTRFAAIFSHIIEYDNAYRFRVEDLMSETTREKLYKNPIKEVWKLKKICAQRDHKNVGWKFQGIALVLCIGLCFPSVRKAFKKAVFESDFEKLQYDDVDRYWTAMRTDYPWWGLEAEERSKWNIGKSMPIPMPEAEYKELISQSQTKQKGV
jgi:hypothetical protein